MPGNRRYSLARYSLGEGRRDIPVQVSFSERMNSLAGAAVPVRVVCRYAEALNCQAAGTLSVPTALVGGGALQARTEVHAVVPVGGVMAEVLSSLAAGAKNVPAGPSFAEVLAGRAVGSKNLRTVLNTAEELNADALVSKMIPAPFVASGALMAVTEATSQTTETVTVELAIPPNGELRIDSELFTVLLDGENVLYAQIGDWIMVSRELILVRVESASGGPLEGVLIYTERFL